MYDHYFQIAVSLTAMSTILVVLVLASGTTVKAAPLLVIAEIHLLIRLFEQSVTVRLLADRSRLEWFVSKLWSSRKSDQRVAIRVLSRVAGLRFGHSYSDLLYSRKAHDRRCVLWKNWWTRHKDRLVWDASLGMYLTPEDSEEEASGDSRN